MSDSNKGRYDNVYMQEMLTAVTQQQGHQETKREQLSKIGKTQKTSHAVLRIVVILVTMAVLGGLAWLAVAEPQYTVIIGAFAALFVLFGASILLFKRN